MLKPSILDSISAPYRALLLERSVHRSVAAHRTLLLSGDRTRRVLLLLRGVVKLAARNGEGRETLLGLALPGDVVGEVAAIDELPQPLDAITATPCEVLGVDADAFMSVIARDPAAADALLRSLAARYRWMCDTALERTSSEVPGRLAGRLLDLADLLGEVREGTIEMEIPLAQEDLARLAGMCRESACKTLRRFKHAGLVDYRGRRLRILRPDALERIRCAGGLGRSR